MLERLLAFAVANRFLVALAALVAAALGATQLAKLPIDAVPDITNRQVQVTTVAPALGPVEMERQVSYVLETALAGTPGLVATRSLSRNGFSQVTAVFTDATSIYFARQQVAERLAQARENLPPGVDPRLGPISTGLGEVLFYTLSFAHLDGRGAPVGERQGWQGDGSYVTPEGDRLATEAQRLTYLRTLQDWVLRPQLSNVADVAGVDALGGFVRQAVVAPDPVRLAARGLTLTELAAAIERSNLSLGAGAGAVDRAGEALVVRADGRVANAGEVAGIVVAERGGAIVRVRDVATVTEGHEVRLGGATENGREVVLGTALMRAGANSRTVAAAARERLAEIAKTLPPDIVARPTLDRSTLVDATIHTVAKNLIEGAVLVIVVLFLVLGNIRAAIITALVIPLSMLLAAAGMVQLGVSGNLMSLGALDFGLIVDGAVIIVENTLRRMAERQHGLGRYLTTGERLDEVVQSSREMLRPSLFGQAIIILVYLPLFAFEGVEAKMFAPMATTVMLALAVAFVASLTFVPAMVALVVRAPLVEKESGAERRVRSGYQRALAAAMQRPWAVVGAAVVVLAGAALLFTTLGREFIPQLDEGNLAVETTRIPSVAVEQSLAMQRQVERAILAAPEVERIFARTGTGEVATDPMPANSSDTVIILKPRAAWPNPSLAKDKLVAHLEDRASAALGNGYEFSQPIQLRFNELIAGVRADVAVKVFGDDFEVMRPVAERVADAIRRVPGAADVRVEQTQGLPALTVKFDRAAIANYGLSVGDVAETIQAAIGGRTSGQIFEGDRRYDIVVRLDDAARADIEALGAIPVKLPSGDAAGAVRAVPLKQLVRFVVETGPNQVSRENGRRRVVVQLNIRGRDLGSFIVAAKAAVARTVQLPPGTSIEWGGQFENLARAQARLSLVVPLVFLAIFALLYAALGSIARAAMVFSAVPLALTGGVVALVLRGMPFSISAAVGFIALSGVAVLNGLVMLTSIGALIAQGHKAFDAIVEGAMTRLRPVLMTALVASLGFVPMALGTGTGAEVQRPIATVVIGGLISATALTLFVLPALALLVMRRTREPTGVRNAASIAAVA